jgi:hypothetical protein
MLTENRSARRFLAQTGNSHPNLSRPRWPPALAIVAGR